MYTAFFALKNAAPAMGKSLGFSWAMLLLNGQGDTKEPNAEERVP